MALHDWQLAHKLLEKNSLFPFHRTDEGLFPLLSLPFYVMHKYDTPSQLDILLCSYSRSECSISYPFMGSYRVLLDRTLKS
jgi:hypothetical protein